MRAGLSQGFTTVRLNKYYTGDIKISEPSVFSSLADACEAGDLGNVRKMLEDGTDIDKPFLCKVDSSHH